MKISVYKFAMLGLLIFSFQQIPAFGQQARIIPLAVKPSSLLDDIKSFRAANPSVSIEDLVKNANSILDREGLNYNFAFKSGVCRQIDEARKKQKDPNAPVSIRGRFNSVQGEQTTIILPDSKTDQSECDCFVQLPVWEATDKDFVTFIKDINVKFFLPQDFFINEMALINSQDLGSVSKRWKIPFKTKPVSISDDGKILFLELPDKQLSDLVIMIFDEGQIQFYARKDLDAAKKSILLQDLPKDAANLNQVYLQFEKNQVKQVIRYTETCQR